MYTYLQHFIDGKPTDSYPNPQTADPYSTTPKSRATKASKRRLCYVPSENKKTKLENTQQSSHNDAVTALLQLSNVPVFNQNIPDTIITETVSNDIPSPTVSLQKNISTPVKNKIRSHIDAKNRDQTVPQLKVQCPDCHKTFEPPQNLVKKYSREKFIHDVLKDNASCMTYTGILTVSLLKEIFKWVEPVAKNIKLWDGKYKTDMNRQQGRPRKSVTLFQEFLLTLIRIRGGYDINHMGTLFAISSSQVSRIFIAWVNCLHQCMKPLLIYPSSEHVLGNLPKSFKKYPKTRVIIDATEFRVTKPFRPGAQKHTWSSYKSSNTLKLLGGIMPSGAFTFVSKLYGGSISDLHIVKRSGFLDLIEEGDDIMADRGFNIRHLLLPKKATLNIPAFSHGKDLGRKALKRSRSIARVRIHVERAFARLKTYRILCGTIPLKLRYLLNQIITIVAVLCNLQPRLAL